MINTQIKEEIISISEFFLSTINADKAQRNIFSLLGGECGQILVQALLYKHTGDIRYKNAIETNINFILDEAQRSDSISPTFCYGIAGLGWLILYLSENKIWEIDPDEFLVDVDEMLAISLDFFLKRNNLDLLHGALGIGIYFLKRGNIAEVEKIIIHLFNVCDRDNNEIKWKQNQMGGEVSEYNLGLAHGQAGILYFLGKCYKNEILQDMCKELIDGSIKFHWNNSQNLYVIGSYFSSSIKCDDYYSSQKIQDISRIAWCYGDLGLLHTILLVSEWLNDKTNYNKAEEMLVNISGKRDPNVTVILDAQFCHGASGVGYLYLNLYRITGNPVFKETAEFWRNEVITMGKDKKKGVLGYLFYKDNMKEIKLEPKLSVLSGLCGVALFLLSCVDPTLDVSWGECLFLN